MAAWPSGAVALSFRPVLIHTNPLESAMTKRKLTQFSATKAVKANARERVGQPKPERVIEEKSKRTGREAKHKEKLEDLIRREE
jgi:hypothetical protein